MVRDPYFPMVKGSSKAHVYQTFIGCNLLFTMNHLLQNHYLIDLVVAVSFIVDWVNAYSETLMLRQMYYDRVKVDINL